MLEYFERLAKGEGFRVETATDGLQTVEKMRRIRPDVAIMDLMLPKYGGLELLYELRRGPSGKIPIIIVTARYTSPSDRAAIEGQPHVRAFFEKPVSAEDLTRALRELAGPAEPPS